MRLWWLLWDNKGMDVLVMTTINTFIQLLSIIRNSVKAIGLWAPLYALKAAGFGCGNQTTGALISA